MENHGIQIFSRKQPDWNNWSIKFMARAGIVGYKRILEGKMHVPEEEENL